MSIITVGNNADFSSIVSAINASVQGDIILVSPGDYTNEGRLYIEKAIHIVGDTVDVINNNIYIQALSFRHINSHVVSSLIFENLYIGKTSGQTVIIEDDVEQNLIFNKCYVYNFGPGFDIYANVYVTVLNCTSNVRSFLINGVASSKNLVYIRDYIESSSSYTKTYYDDSVNYSTEGYGTLYGRRYINLPTKYYFTGKVTVSGVPVRREVKAYRRDIDTLISSTFSDITSGEYKLLTTYEGEHYLVCKDDSNGTIYNDLVRARVVPKIENYETTLWDGSKKFELVIDHSLIDVDLYNFQICIHLNNTSGTNSFDTTDILHELVSPLHSTRISLQNEDKQQLWCEIVKWDYTSQEVLLWAQIPIISASEDTKLTLYYDRNKNDNLYFTGYSSNVLIRHLWGSSAIGVWHMSEDPSSIKASSFLSYNAEGHGLSTNDSVSSELGKAITCSTGYLLVDEAIKNVYSDNITIMSFVKFSDINTRGTIFATGDINRRIELGVKNSKLHFKLADKEGYNKGISTTLSGLNLANNYLVTATLDKNNKNIKLYIDDTLKVEKTFRLDVASYVDDIGTSIGSNYLSDPTSVCSISGVTIFDVMPITLTTSGTVASGTVCLLTTSLTSYSDLSGRHSFIPKKATEMYLSDERLKVGESSIVQFYGTKDSDPLNAYNYFKITDKPEDFGFEAGQDFTISGWVKFVITSYASVETWWHLDLLGSLGSNSTKCLRVGYAHRHFYYGSWRNYSYISLIIPDDSGGYVVDTAIYLGDYSIEWLHIALVRNNGLIYLYVNGEQKYSVAYSGKIPNASIFSREVGLGVMYSDYDLSSTNESYYGAINSFEVLKGKARWSGAFNVECPLKSSPDSFFSGQIDELMVYSEIKDINYIKIFYNSIKDTVISYS